MTLRPTDPAYLAGYSQAMHEAASIAENGAALSRYEARKCEMTLEGAAMLKAALTVERLARAYRYLGTHPTRDTFLDNEPTPVRGIS